MNASLFSKQWAISFFVWTPTTEDQFGLTPKEKYIYMKVPTHSSLQKKIFQELKGTDTAIPSEIIFEFPLSPLFP